MSEERTGGSCLAKLGEGLRAAGPDGTHTFWRWDFLSPDRYVEALWIQCAEMAKEIQGHADGDAAGREIALMHLSDLWSLGMEASLQQEQSLDEFLAPVPGAIEPLNVRETPEAAMSMLAFWQAEGGKGDVLRDKSLALLGGMLSVFWSDKNANGRKVDIGAIRSSLSLEAVEGLALQEGGEELVEYLDRLPGWDIDADGRFATHAARKPERYVESILPSGASGRLAAVREHGLVAKRAGRALRHWAEFERLTGARPDGDRTDFIEATGRMASKSVRTRRLDVEGFLKALACLGMDFVDFLPMLLKWKSMPKTHFPWLIVSGAAASRTLDLSRPPRKLAALLPGLYAPMMDALAARDGRVKLAPSLRLLRSRAAMKRLSASLRRKQAWQAAGQGILDALLSAGMGRDADAEEARCAAQRMLSKGTLSKADFRRFVLIDRTLRGFAGQPLEQGASPIDAQGRKRGAHVPT